MERKFSFDVCARGKNQVSGFGRTNSEPQKVVNRNI